MALIITVQEDCEYITLTADPEEIFSDIQDSPTSACCYQLTLGLNCCGNTVLPIRSLYTFGYSITDCGTELIEDILKSYVDITFTGVNASCVSNITYTQQESPFRTLSFDSPTDMTFRSYIAGPGVKNYDVVITTTCGLEYLLEFTITVVTICSTTQSALTVTYPELPAGVEITGVGLNMILYPEAFGLTGDTLPAGIYFISISDNNVSLSDSVFIDCGVLCKVIDYISRHCTSNLYIVFEALQMSQDCETITYAQKCSMWNYLGRRLGYFTTTPCVVTSNCKPCVNCKKK